MSKKNGGKKIKGTSNFEIDKNEKLVRVSINPKIFSLSMIYSACYIFIDKAYVIIDGNPEKEVIVKLFPKEGYDLDKLGMEFNNELLSFAVYETRTKKNISIRDTLLKRALLTNEVETSTEETVDFIDDPEGIAIPWEEKYGKKSRKT